LKQVLEPKAEIRFIQNSPDELFDGLDNLPGEHLDNDFVKVAKTDFGSLSSIVYYRKVESGLWCVKVEYNFHEDTDIIADISDPDPYYEMKYFIIHKGRFTMTLNDREQSLHNKVLFNNSEISSVWHANAGSRVSKYMFLFTKEFLAVHFHLDHPTFKQSVLANIVHFKKSYLKRDINEQEFILLRSLDDLLTKSNNTFLKPVSLQSYIIPLLSTSFEMQAADEPDETINEAFSVLIKYMSGKIYEEFPGLEKLAGKMNMSTSTFKRKFNERFDTTPELYFKKIQMDAAESMLSTKSISLKELAGKFGYSSAQNFTIAFKKTKGYVP
jgi:AraC-like DNA-binding protein